MKIFFDVDGVLSDFTRNVIQIADNLWRGSVPEGYIPTDWNYSDLFTAEQWDKIWESIKAEPNFWLKSRPIHDNMVALRHWRYKNPQHQIYYITSRVETAGYDAQKQTELWLWQQGLHEGKERVIAVRKADEKKAVVAEHGIDFGIDDYIPTVQALNQLSGHQCYLLDASYNQDSNQTRVHSVREFLSLVDAEYRIRES